MTTSSEPLTALRLGHPGELIAAVPGLLGFSPTRSLVLICLEGVVGSTVGLCARVDLPVPDDPPAARAVVEQLAAVCAHRSVPAAILLVVDEPGQRVGADPRAAPWRALIRAARCALEEVGTEVCGAHHVPRIADGQPWGSYRGGEHGLVADPGASPVAVAHVVAGRVMHRSREELVAVLKPDPGHPHADVDANLRRAEHALHGAGAGQRFGDLAAIVTSTAEPGRPGAGNFSPDELVRAAVALQDVCVRDAAFGFAASTHADGAHELWTTLVRNLPSPYAVEAAVLLAHSSYCTGEGAMAGVALERALAVDPGHRMATLISASLSSGLDPARMRDVASSALTEARALGVPLESRG